MVGVTFHAVITALFVLAIAAFYLRSTLFPICCDASSYLVIGHSLWTQGLSVKFPLSDVRTIGYPAFVALALWLPIPLGLTLKIVLLQSTLYWLATLAVLRASRWLIVDRPSRRALLVGLLCNPLAAMYCAETLTESLSLTMFLTMVALLLAVRGGPMDHRRRYTTPFWLGLLAGLGLIVRPANLAIFIAALVAMALPPLFAAQPLRRRLLHAMRAAGITLVGTYLTLSPQVAVNWKHHNQATPFPVVSLRDMQVREGIRHLKYATLVSTPKAQRVFYASPFAKGTEVRRTDTLDWYLRNPGRGLLNAAGHIFATVDQDPFFTYVRDLQPWYRVPLVIINAVVVVFGFAWLVRTVWRSRRQAARLPATWFILSSLAFSLGIASFAIPESRFGIVVTTMCFVSACIGATRTYVERPKVRPTWLLAGFAGCAIFALLALGMRGLANM